MIRSLFWGFVFLNVITLTGLAIYFSAVHLNLIFTFKYLPVSSIPWYSTTVTYSSGSDRYGFDFFVYALDVLMFIPPVSSLADICSAVLYPRRTRYGLGALIFVTIVVVLQTIYRGISYGYCYSWSQFCRAYDGSTSGTNYVWQWTFWFTFAYWVPLFFYILLTTQIDSAQHDYFKELERAGYTRIMPATTWELPKTVKTKQ